jgi:hypothetical protein
VEREWNEPVRRGWGELWAFISREGGLWHLGRFGQGGAHGEALVGGEGRWRGSRGSKECLCRLGTEEQAAARFSLI